MAARPAGRKRIDRDRLAVKGKARAEAADRQHPGDVRDLQRLMLRGSRRQQRAQSDLRLHALSPAQGRAEIQAVYGKSAVAADRVAAPGNFTAERRRAFGVAQK